MMEKHILLVNPPIRGLPPYEPLGLLYLASSLRVKGFKVELLDFTLHAMPLEQAVKETLDKAAGFIGVTMPFQPSATAVMGYINAVRAAGYKGFLVAGGIFPTFAYEDILNACPGIDAVARGDGEETVVELAEKVLAGETWQNVRSLAYRVDSGVTCTPVRPSPADLDALPFPARDTLAEVYARDRTAAMYTSRGCYGRCTFCSIVPFFRMQGTAIRFRSAGNVVDEIEELVKGHGVKNIMFDDSNFTNSAKRCEEIAREILRRGLQIRFSIECRADDVDRELFTLLAQAGLKRVFLGVESGSDTQLARYGKQTTVEQSLKALGILNELQIYTTIGFIMVDADTTVREVFQNIKLRKALKRLSRGGYAADQHLYGSVMIPLAGTEYERHAKECGAYRGGTFRPQSRIRSGAVRILRFLLNAGFVLSGGFMRSYARYAKWCELWKLP